ncbi:MAG: DUF1800 domain-containing protein [Caulobacteraceae bacterium]|nr:DUF1800 domain-containing protein [Caulobacteraceae bacterium]
MRRFDLRRGAVSAIALLACLAVEAPAVAAPTVNLALLDRVTWGVNASSATAMAALGPDRYVERQLQASPRDRLPPQAQAQVDALRITQEPMVNLVVDIDQQGKAANALTDPDQKKAAQQAYQQAMSDLAKQAMTRSLLRALYSPDQLLEQTTWFWMNHFSVHQYKSNIRVMIGDYEENAIRAHALGRFRDLLSATLHHPVMLRYLDNDQNAVGHINENYAREIMELHTMGVGSGYTQKDVEELARILTGVGVNQTSTPPKVKPQLQDQYVHAGLFEFNPNRHDYGDKVFLGHVIKGRGLAEVDEALDILAREPATARHVSRQLATYFVADDPAPALVERMASTFRRTDGDIAAVLRTMFASPEFKASLHGKFKDPAHYVVSAVRLAYDDKVVLNVAPMQGWLGRMAEPLYGRETPDGYPLGEAAWSGPGGMATRFEIARQIGSGSAGLFKADGPQPQERPAFPLIANALYFNGLSQTLTERTRGVLDQATSPQDWNTLFLSSPEFMRR